MRVQTLDGPHIWAEGDYSKTLPDGTEAAATYAEYCAYIGVPVGLNKKITESPATVRRRAAARVSAANGIDCFELLQKYIEHVESCEGVNYLDVLNESYRSDVRFTDAEVAALRALDAPR